MSQDRVVSHVKSNDRELTPEEMSQVAGGVHYTAAHQTSDSSGASEWDTGHTDF